MNYVNINPGIKTGLRQPYTITMGGQIFFLTYDESRDTITWNQFIDDDILKQDVEKTLKTYLTNQ